ncbi:succinylarginine dihydrolase [Legionella beliardensis]|uniref:N-succinylarginine dihydrolase n=1 Tax=Legionella beliardensis TaxID=91822 RepID=A0A378I2U6_9GAMM|nr:N-succinylarginine dihydrolase [Legionella beliardensis]STX29262.1 succinylarginine dihydrolase [Legionella beliardensis]
MTVYELNIDGLVGPNHNYAGLSAGNIASTTNALSIANPQAAALQGLQKMQMLHNMGIKQAILPPHQRPNFNLLTQLGFDGSPEQQINTAAKIAPELLAACYSASSMWSANAATVSASLDCADNHVHFTAANLISNLHRHQEAPFSEKLLQKIFADERYFHHHAALPKSLVTSDEGAANHSRLCKTHSSPGTSLFVYSKKAMQPDDITYQPRRYPARQTLEASEAIARAHLLNPKHIVFARQNPTVVDQGVFHNDVIAVANEHVLLIHESAFLNQQAVLDELELKTNFLQVIEVKENQLSVTDAVSTYLFNSQLITLPDDSMMLIAPSECEINSQVRQFIAELITDKNNPINQVYFLDLKQSMRNGGGPACLRLRVPLTTYELQAMHQGVLLTDTLFTQLESWIYRHYRTELQSKDLADFKLVNEIYTALDELTELLNLGSIYPFQQENSVLCSGKV